VYIPTRTSVSRGFCHSLIPRAEAEGRGGKLMSDSQATRKRFVRRQRKQSKVLTWFCTVINRRYNAAFWEGGRQISRCILPTLLLRANLEHLADFFTLVNPPWQSVCADKTAHRLLQSTWAHESQRTAQRALPAWISRLLLGCTALAVSQIALMLLPSLAVRIYCGWKSAKRDQRQQDEFEG